MRSRRWAVGILGTVLATGAATLVQVAPGADAAPQPSIRKTPSAGADRSLGNGLGRMLPGSESAKPSARLKIDQNALAIRDSQGRVLVQLTPQSDENRAAFRRQAEARGLRVQAVDREHGTLEGFVPLSSVRALADLEGTGTLVQAIRPITDIGAATSQGVALHRADRVQRRGVDGAGITIGALSDSYNSAQTTVNGDPLTIRAADDVASGDLPGPGNPRNPQPVVVIEDTAPNSSDFDEGRGMLQIAHDVAPGAKLCFATANGGTLNFANNIRRLADHAGRCGADVVVDDITYFDEPMFSDGPVSDAIDDVAARGVHYFSSAGNAGNQQAWASRVRLLPAASAVRGTNLDLTGVDPALYDGGLQDMDPGPGTDVAQDIFLGENGGIIDLQWNDPVDVDGATFGDPIFEATGEITAANPAPSFAFTPSADQVGKTVQFRTDAIPSGTTDLILSVDAPDGTNLGTIDTGSSPEVLAAKLSQAGTYKITITGFDGDTGDFTVDVREVLSPSRVTTDFNVLFFAPNGQFLAALADLNTLSGRPIELAGLPPFGGLQMAISRAGTGPVGATELRNVMFDDMHVVEYADPLAPATFAHHTARGATGVAAYDAFRPLLPEFFTSPGGDLRIYFDSAGNRFRRPQVRRVPQVAAADGGNTTFFVNDTARDPDTLPNFFGTSAAAPHAAAIAALVLDRAGGPRSISPTQMRRLLQRSAFTHDLDPAHSGGRVGGLTLSANGGQGSEGDPVAGAMIDPRFFTLRYTGRVPLRSVTFLGETASPTALGSGGRSAGVVFDPRPFDGVSPFREDGFPFTIGQTSGGLRAASVSAQFSVPGTGESVAGQFRHMTIRFANGLRRGQTLRFGVDRDLAVSGIGGANEGNGADELGGATFLPGGRAVRGGMRFNAVRADGRVLRGVMVNRLGVGFSKVDGFGLINAERAVFGPR